MKYIYLIALLCVLPAIGMAQTVTNQDIASSRLQGVNHLGAQGRTQLIGFDNRDSELEGSPYMSDTWLPASLMLDDSLVVSDVLLRYDVYFQQVEVKFQEEMKVGNNLQIKEFTFQSMPDAGRARFISLKKHASAAEDLGFGQVLLADKVSLIRHHHAVVKKPNYKEGLHMGNMNSKIIKKDKLYLLRNNALTEISEKSFAGHESEMKAFMKKNKLKLKNEGDLIEIIKHYNTLL